MRKVVLVWMMLMAAVGGYAQAGDTGYQFLRIPTSAHSAALGRNNVSDVWAKSRLLMIIGSYSLYIYLTHIIVFNVVNNLLLHVCERSYWLGGVSLIITLGICVGVAWVIERSKWIKLIVFAKK